MAPGLVVSAVGGHCSGFELGASHPRRAESKQNQQEGVVYSLAGKIDSYQSCQSVYLRLQTGRTLNGSPFTASKGDSLRPSKSSMLMSSSDIGLPRPPSEIPDGCDLRGSCSADKKT